MHVAVAKKFPAISLAQAHALLTRPGSPFEMEERDIRGVRTRVWKNAPPTMREVFLLARAHGNKTFVVYRDERVSYEEFARAALAIAEALQQAGVKKGDRVAIAMRNLPEWPAAFFGCLLVGGIATLLNAWWTGPELQYGLNDSGAKVAIVDRERLERLFEHLPNCPALERVFVSRHSEDIAHPQVAKLESRHRRRELLASLAGPAVAERAARSGGRRHDPLHLGHDRKAERRARHASQFHDVGHRPVRSVRRALFCGAASRCRRPIRMRRKSPRCWWCRCFTPPAAMPP